MHARAAKDNRGSLAVLRKCGFVVRGEDHGYAAGRGHDVEEWRAGAARLSHPRRRPARPGRLPATALTWAGTSLAG